MMRPGDVMAENEWRPEDLDGHEAEEAFRLTLADDVTTELNEAEAEERRQSEYLKLLDDED